MSRDRDVSDRVDHCAVGCLAIAILLAALAFAIVPALLVAADKIVGFLLCLLFMAFG